MEDKDILAELSSIKNIMERSTKFISLSGLSGVLAGVYALIGAGLGYKLINDHANQYGVHTYSRDLNIQLFILAVAVLVLSIGTGLLLTFRKAKRKGQRVSTQASRALFRAGAVPLVTGGCLVLILLYHGHYSIIAPGCLIFYGLALYAASQYTFGDVKWLGLCDILLGLVAALVPGYGLLCWAVGFGVLHIFYGTVMHFKYDREDNAK